MLPLDWIISLNEPIRVLHISELNGAFKLYLFLNLTKITIFGNFDRICHRSAKKRR